MSILCPYWPSPYYRLKGLLANHDNMFVFSFAEDPRKFDSLLPKAEHMIERSMIISFPEQLSTHDTRQAPPIKLAEKNEGKGRHK